MWIYTLISTVLGAGGFGLGLWNLWRSHRQPVRDLQFERRKNFAKMLELFHRQVSEHEQKAKAGVLPNPETAGNLKAATEMFRDAGNKLVVPTKPQIQRLSDRVTSLVDAIDKYMIPVDDKIFTEPVPADVIRAFELLRADIEYTLAGLWKIETGKALRAKQQFKELET